MIPLRDNLPSRRANPTLNPTGDNWSAHKPDLKVDFNDHCGYCHSYDGYRHTYFEVDHFVPKRLFTQGNTITLTQYSNLVYSCKFCNNNKSGKWPTESETVHNTNDEGFVDPCSADYDTHFYRTPEGAIRWRTPLGKWMFSKAFKFDEREKSIVVLWNMNHLRKIIDALIVVLKSFPENSEDYNTTKLKLGEFTLQYYMFHKELIEFYEG